MKNGWHKLGCGLTVIILVILPLGLSIPFGLRRGGHGPEMRVRSELQNLVIAMKGYQIEYDRLPVEFFPASESKPQEVKGQILLLLMQEGQHPSNPRNIGFLEGYPARDGKRGTHMPEVGFPVFADPWGHPYFIIMDLNGDGKIPNPAKGKRVFRSSEIEPETLELEVAAFSSGPDGNPDTWEDNIASWR